MQRHAPFDRIRRSHAVEAEVVGVAIAAGAALEVTMAEPILAGLALGNGLVSAAGFAAGLAHRDSPSGFGVHQNSGSMRRAT